MPITAKYANPEETVILVSDGIVETNVPKDPANKDYAALVTNAVPISAYQKPPPTAADVRAERDRRQRLLVGASNKAEFDEIVGNATREAVRLLRKGEANWTPDESARAAELENSELQLAEIETRSAELEANPPANYQDDAVWNASSP